MSVKSQRIFTVGFIAFLAIIMVVSFLFADKLPHMKEPEGITGGYLFTFQVQCVDEAGKTIATKSMTGNGTLWSFEPPELEGYTTECKSITRSDITNWSYPPSHYDREAHGSITVLYSPLGE